MILEYFFSDTALFLAFGGVVILMTVLSVRYGRVQVHRNQFLIFWLIFPPACCLGYYYVHQTVDEIEREQERRVSVLIRISAHTLACYPGIRPLQHTEKFDLRWNHVRNLLLSWQNMHEDVTAFYILQKNREGTGSVVFSTSKPRAIFTSDLDEKDTCAQTVAQAFQGESAKGKWMGPDNKIYRIFAEPLESDRSGVRTVLCLETRDWSGLVLTRRIWPHLFFGSFLVFIALTQLIFIRRRLLSEKLRETRVVRYEKALESLLSAQGLAKQEAEAKNLLLLQINTELKSPIIPILESSYFLSEQIRDDGEGAADIDWNLVDRILKNNMKLQEVLDDLKIFVELEWKCLVTKQVRFSPERLIREIRNDWQVVVQEHPEMTFLIDVRKPMPAYVLGDEAKVKRALQRLVDWIIGESSEGHVKLICSVSGSSLYLEMIESEHRSSIPERRESTFLSYCGSYFEFPSRDEKMFNFKMHVASRLVQFLGGNVTISVTSGRDRHYEIVVPIGLIEETSADPRKRPSSS